MGRLALDKYSMVNPLKSEHIFTLKQFIYRKIHKLIYRKVHKLKTSITEHLN